jgi:hypothetical protein
MGGDGCIIICGMCGYAGVIDGLAGLDFQIVGNDVFNSFSLICV